MSGSAGATVSAAHKAACVIGWPARHSRSPMLHGHWIERYGLDASYRAEEIAPEDVRQWLRDFGHHGYVGANVTMPHKDIALEMSTPDERALAVGAANTLWLDGGQLRSTNTDVEGFINAVDATAPGWRARTGRAVVLGAGGAARAIIYGLLESGVEEIHVVNRTLRKAESLRERFGARVHPADWASIGRVMEGTGLLVNATSLGMKGHGDLAIDIAGLGDEAVVADIVYVPLRTPLLVAAARRGLATSNGLDMLLHQAVRGFELWFGVRPEVTPELYDLLAADIQSGQ